MNIKELILRLMMQRGGAQAPGPGPGANPAMAGQRPIPGVSDASGAPVLQRGGPEQQGLQMPQEQMPRGVLSGFQMPDVEAAPGAEVPMGVPLPDEGEETMNVMNVPGGQVEETFPGNVMAELEGADTEGQELAKSRLRQEMILQMLQRAGQFGSPYTARRRG